MCEPNIKIKAFFGLYNFLWITATNLLLNEIYDFLFDGFIILLFKKIIIPVTHMDTGRNYFLWFDGSQQNFYFFEIFYYLG